MGAQDKTLKFSIGADESAFRRAGRLVDEFTSKVTRAATELLRLNQSMQRGGGGMGGGGFTPLSVRGAGISPGSQLASKMTSGPASWLTSTLNDNQKILTAIAGASKDSLKEMTKGVKEEAGRQRAELRWLKKDAEELAAAYKHLRSLEKAGITPRDPSASQGHWNALQGAQAQIRSGEDRLGHLEFAENKLKPTKWGAAKEAMGDLMQGRRPTQDTMQQLGGVAMAGAVGYAVGKVIVGTLRSGMHEAEQAPHDFIGRAMKQGGAFGHAAMGLKGGDMSLQAAYRLMRGNDQFSKDFNALSRGAGDSSGFERGTSGGVAFDVEGQKKDRTILGSLWRNKFNPLAAGNEMKRGLDNLPVDMTTDQLSYLQNMKQAAPLYFEARDQLYQNAGGNVAGMNALRMGARKMTGDSKDARTYGSQGAQINSGLRALRKATDSGVHTDGDLIGAFNSIDQVAGGEAGHRGMFSVMGGRAGGIHNAGQIWGTAAMNDAGGSGGTFWKNLQNSIGRGSGGMDVGAANRMGGTVAGAMMSGMAPTSGLGLLGAMNAYGRGGSGAGDMQIQSFMPQGLQAMGAVTGGSVDAYQSGSNLLNAIHAAPNASVFAQEYLAQMDPRVLFDVIGKGEVPPELKARGITFEMVKSYADKTMARTYDRNVGMSPMQGEADPMQAQAQEVQGKFGGDFKAYFDSGRKGLKGKARAEWESTAFTERGAYLQSVGLAPNDMAGSSFARLEAGRGQYGTGPFMAGRGAGAAAAGSVEALDMSERSKEQGRLEQIREGSAAELRGDIDTRGSTGLAGGLAKVGNEVGGSPAAVAAAFGKAASAADTLTASLIKAAGAADKMRAR